MHKLRAFIIIIVGGTGMAIAGLLLFSGRGKTPIDIGSQTGDIAVIRIATGQVSKITKTITDEPNAALPIVRVAMPRWLYTPALQNLVRDFQQEEKTQIEILLSDSPNAYQQTLDNDFLGNQTIDLALIPSDWIRSYDDHVVALTLDASLRGVFHRSFYNELTNQSATYIPFAIDPFMTIVRKGLRDTTQSIGLGALQSLARKSYSSTLPLPFVFGLSEVDRQLLSKGREAYPHQFVAIAQLFDTAIREQDKQLLNQLIDAASSIIPGTRNYATMRAILATNKDDSDDCNHYPAGCLLASHKSSMTLASASDVSSRELYNSGFKSYDYDLLPFPNTTQTYPIRLRGWYTSDHAGQRNALQRLINTLLQQGQSDDSLLPPLLISPFLARMASTETSVFYPAIRQEENKRNPVIASTQGQKDTIAQRGREELFAKRIDPNLRLYQQYEWLGNQGK